MPAHLESKFGSLGCKFPGYADWQPYGPSGDADAAFFATGIRSSTGSTSKITWADSWDTHVKGFVCCRFRKNTKSPSTCSISRCFLLFHFIFPMYLCILYNIIDPPSISGGFFSIHPCHGGQAIALVCSLVCMLFNCLQVMRSPSRWFWKRFDAARFWRKHFLY